ncbi:MAG TPA: ABC transporter permease, partial [Candidatus Angelobacter sp.]|nr:ABC transporter permease [Candidatus Angelobacter sp.]
MESFLQDIRYGLRVLWKSRGFTLVAILTLALGIGATTAVFSVINAVLLRPLPLDHAEQLATITSEDMPTHTPGIGASWTKFQFMRDQQRAFAGVTAFTNWRQINFADRHEAVQVPGGSVSSGFFTLLGTRLVQGHDFSSAEEDASAAPVAIVSYGFWQRRLNADPNVLSPGRNIMLDGVSTTIIGVLPPDFRIQFGQDEPEVWLSRPAVSPIMTPVQVRSGAGYLTYVVRLRPQVTLAQAQSELDAISARYKTEFAGNVDAPNNGLRIVDFNEGLVGNVRPSLLVLLAGVALVLLIACANVSHLLMARAAGRQKEIGLRSALGASRKRLVRQLLTESLLLSLLGCGVGLFFSQLCLKLLLTGGPKDVPRLYQASLDGPVLLFALVISLITAIIFGLAPAFHSARVDLNTVLKDQGRGSTAHGRSGTIRNLLTISETAIAVMLVVGSALLMETLVQLQNVKLGFEPANVLTGRLTLAPAAYREPQQKVAFTRALLGRLQNQPGVEAVAIASYIPLRGGDFGFYFFVEGQPSLGMGKDPGINVRHISPRYFSTLRIPVLQGRDFTDQDNESTMPVAIVNEQTARRYWPGQSAVGKRLANSRDKIMRQVVGVAGDVRSHGPSTSVMDELYLPYAQVPWPTVNVV